jgi:hypothetical protein
MSNGGDTSTSSGTLPHEHKNVVSVKSKVRTLHRMAKTSTAQRVRSRILRNLNAYSGVRRLTSARDGSMVGNVVNICKLRS